MKKGVVVLLLLLNISFVQAGLFDGVWDVWLSGDVVSNPSLNKDFELVSVEWNGLHNEVLAKVCNRGTIAVNFNNIHFAKFVIDGISSDWVYPQSYGYRDDAKMQRLSSSTVYTGECIVLAKTVASQPSEVMVRIDPDDLYLEAYENNNERTVQFNDPTLAVLLDAEAEINDGEEPSVAANNVQNVSGFFIVSLLLFVGVVLAFFLRQVNKKKNFMKF